MESITELRKISQSTRQTAIYKPNWYDRNVQRRFSIYVSRLCMMAGVNPDAITFVDFLFVLASGICFLFPSPAMWLVGFVLFLLYLFVDCMDGEVARYQEYKGTRKPQPLGRGSFMGGCVDALVWPFMFVCMGFGLYQVSGSVIPIACGAASAVMRTLYMDLALIPYPILHDYDKLGEIKSSTETLGEPKIMSMGRMFFGIQGFIPCMLAVIILDWVLGTGELFRTLYLLLFAVGATFGVLMRIVSVWRHGVRIQRI